MRFKHALTTCTALSGNTLTALTAFDISFDGSSQETSTFSFLQKSTCKSSTNSSSHLSIIAREHDACVACKQDSNSSSSRRISRPRGQKHVEVWINTGVIPEFIVNGHPEEADRYSGESPQAWCCGGRHHLHLLRRRYSPCLRSNEELPVVSQRALSSVLVPNFL